MPSNRSRGLIWSLDGRVVAPWAMKRSSFRVLLVSPNWRAVPLLLVPLLLVFGSTPSLAAAKARLSLTVDNQSSATVQTGTVVHLASKATHAPQVM
jgi:hypothetical protein